MRTRGRQVKRMLYGCDRDNGWAYDAELEIGIPH
jgi:hypothetical protein